MTCGSRIFSCAVLTPTWRSPPKTVSFFEMTPAKTHPYPRSRHHIAWCVYATWLANAAAISYEPSYTVTRFLPQPSDRLFGRNNRVPVFILGLKADGFPHFSLIFGLVALTALYALRTVLLGGVDVDSNGIGGAERRLIALAQKARKRRTGRDNFLALSHELRTALTGFWQWRMQNREARGRSALEIIRRNIRVERHRSTICWT